MLQVLRVRHKGVCATKDPLRESLIDGSKKTQPIIKIKSTAKDLERQPWPQTEDRFRNEQAEKASKCDPEGGST